MPFPQATVSAAVVAVAAPSMREQAGASSAQVPCHGGALVCAHHSCGDWVALCPPSVIRQFTRYSWDSRTNDDASRKNTMVPGMAIETPAHRIFAPYFCLWGAKNYLTAPLMQKIGPFTLFDLQLARSKSS